MIGVDHQAACDTIHDSDGHDDCFERSRFFQVRGCLADKHQRQTQRREDVPQMDAEFRLRTDENQQRDRRGQQY